MDHTSPPSPSALLYVTAPDIDIARRIAEALLERRLVACANILEQVTSLYRWEGAIQESPEVAILLKTTHERINAAQSCILSLHPYDCPCVIALPITQGHLPFLQWIQDQTSANPHHT